MVLLTTRTSDLEETMPQTVPSAGFTPPCDYSNFAENFDLSLLPGGDQPLQFQHQIQPQIYTTFCPDSPDLNDFRPDFQTLLEKDQPKPKQYQVPPTTNIYLEVPTNTTKTYHQPNSPLTGNTSPYSPQGLLSPNNDHFNSYRQSSEAYFYPSSPELSLYTPSPGSVYSRSPCDDFLQTTFNSNKSTSPYPYRVKEENFLSPCNFSSPTSPAASYSSLSSPEQITIHHQTDSDVLELLENTVLDKQIKQESTVDFASVLGQNLLEEPLKECKPQIVPLSISPAPSAPRDHQLLREVLRDTSFQKKYNIKPFDFGLIGGGDNNNSHNNNSGRSSVSNSEIKMEEPDEGPTSELMRENIEPVFNLAIEQMKKDVDTTCSALGISPDPKQWSSANVLSWLQWTSRQFGLNEPVPEQWDMSGTNLMSLSEEDFTRRSPQGGMILHAQLEIWKAAYSEEELGMQWMPETASSNASSGDVSDEEDEEPTTSQTDITKPTTSRTGGSHIHLWQFLKELLASPQTHGSCIRWLDRSKGIFKIEDSVKVARLWGKRKNRPAMNYDKLSRSIRQYYKKGIMKKTERSQRLVYQFCHPYNL